jgi:hypothetical protein
MFADAADTITTTVTPSGGWSDPAAWAALGKEIGPGGLYTFLLLGFGLFMVWYVCSRVCRYLFGPNGLLERLFGPNGLLERAWQGFQQFLTTMTDNTATTARTLECHMHSCVQLHASGGPCNVEDLREGVHGLAELGRAAGTQLGVDVSSAVEQVHKSLRRAPQSAA